MYVKICGTTTAEDAALATQAGTDALGFIFAPSPRRILPEAAGQIATPAHVQRVGIFVNPSVEEVLTTLRTARLDAVQLHETPQAVAEALRPHLPTPRVPPPPQEHGSRVPHVSERHGNHPSPPTLIGALHFTPGTTEDAFLAALENQGRLYDAILLDSRTAAAAGGTGLTFDWHAARQALARTGRPLPRLIVAGGLHPGNVAEAIRTLQPWGVDVVTGVEAAPGRKHPEKLRAFVEAVRALEMPGTGGDLRGLG